MRASSRLSRADLAPGERFGERKPAEFGAGVLELRELACVLDPLGDRLEVERLAELQDRVQERGLIWPVGHAGDERAVDLEDVDRELPDGSSEE